MNETKRFYVVCNNHSDYSHWFHYTRGGKTPEGYDVVIRVTDPDDIRGHSGPIHGVFAGNYKNNPKIKAILVALSILNYADKTSLDQLKKVADSV